MFGEHNRSASEIENEKLTRSIRYSIGQLAGFLCPLIGLGFLVAGLAYWSDGETNGAVFCGAPGLFLTGGSVIAIFRAVRAKEVNFGWSFRLIGIGFVMILIGLFDRLAMDDIKQASSGDVLAFLILFLGGFGLFLSGWLIATMRVASGPEPEERIDWNLLGMKHHLSKARDHFEPDEEVISMIRGQRDIWHSGIFIATNQRLIFCSKRLTGFDLEIFPYKNISSIEMGKNLMGHYISFFAAGNKVLNELDQNGWRAKVRRGRQEQDGGL